MQVERGVCRDHGIVPTERCIILDTVHCSTCWEYVRPLTPEEEALSANG